MGHFSAFMSGLPSSSASHSVLPNASSNQSYSSSRSCDISSSSSAIYNRQIAADRIDPFYSVLWASLGNTVGGMSCYYIGYLGKVEWAEKYFKVKHEKIQKMQKFLQGKGALMGFFGFLPTFGEIIAMTLGFMRSNVIITTASMFVGKLIRYIIIAYFMIYAAHGISALYSQYFG